MVVSDIAGNDHHVSSILVRARFCQRIAESAGTPAESAFTVGLLDAVCDLHGQPRHELVPGLSLSRDLNAALLEGTGPLAGVLALARAYEADSTSAAAGVGLSAADLTRVYLESLHWAQQVLARNPER